MRIELNRYLWRDQPHVKLWQLWDDLACSCYLPRLYSEEVLIAAISDGVARDAAPFGSATRVGADGVYNGLRYQQPLSRPYFDDNDVLVQSDVAEEAVHGILPPPLLSPTPILIQFRDV